MDVVVEKDRIVALHDHGMATSGDYRSYYELDGRRIDDLPYEEYAEEPEPEEEATWWERMATTISGDLNLHHVSRRIAVRFGDLERIRVTGGDDAVLTLRDGTEIEVSGYANDVGATVVVGAAVVVGGAVVVGAAVMGGAVVVAAAASAA